MTAAAGQRLRKLRERYGLVQAAFWPFLGLTQSQGSKIERGDSAPTDLALHVLECERCLDHFVLEPLSSDDPRPRFRAESKAAS